MNRAGRPSRISPVRMAAIIVGLKAGMLMKHASEAGAVSYSTCNWWIKRGRMALDVAAADNPGIHDEIADWLAVWDEDAMYDAHSGMWDSPGVAGFTDVDGFGQETDVWVYVLFFMLTERARALAVRDAVAAIQQQAAGDWHAAAWFLSHSHPEEYGNKSTLEHTGPNGGPIQHHIGVEQLEAELKELAEQRGIESGE